MSIKLLILADIHSQTITLENILDSVKRMGDYPQICLLAGDITHFGTIEDMENILNSIVEKISNTFYIIGNCDPFPDNNILDTLAINVEARYYDVSFFSIIGFGTHRPKLNQKLLKKLKKENKKVCLLTHTPPFNTSTDIVSFNRHAGSQEVREFIEKNENIFLAISGHIHESPSISKLNKCIIINPGPVTTGNFALIEIHKDFTVEGKIYNLHEL